MRKLLAICIVICFFNIPVFSQTTSGTLVSTEAWSTTVTLTGDVFVPANISLYLNSTATVNLGAYAIVSTGGTIYDQGADINGLRATLENISTMALVAYCGRIQKAFDNAEVYPGDNRYVTLEDGNFEENVTISSEDGLAIYGNDYKQFGTLIITNSDAIVGAGFGARRIQISGCDIIYLSGIDLDNYDDPQTTTGFNVSYSDDILLRSYSTIASSSTGLAAYTSDVTVKDGMIYETSTAVSSMNEAYVIVDTTWMCLNDLDFSLYNFSTVRSHGCWFEDATPVIYNGGGSSITISNKRACDLPSTSIVAASPENSALDVQEIEMYKAVVDNFSGISSSYNTLNREFAESLSIDNIDFAAYSPDEFLSVAKNYKNFIAENPGSPLSTDALLAVSKCYSQAKVVSGDKDVLSPFKIYLTEILSNNKYAALHPVAEKLMIKSYLKEGNSDAALNKVDELLTKYKDDESHTADLLYSKGLIFTYYKNQADEASKYFNTVLAEYPDDPVAHLSENELALLEDSNQPADELNSEMVISDDITLGCYPNPFNPVTTITFTLPQQDNVKLVVYDVLGREVMKLANGAYQAGEHKFRFNASNLASGMYIYRLETSNTALTKKMMLLK